MILRMVRNILRRRKKKTQPCSHLDMAAVHDALRDNYAKVLKEELEKPSERLFVIADQACEPFLIPPHYIRFRYLDNGCSTKKGARNDGNKDIESKTKKTP